MAEPIVDAWLKKPVLANRASVCVLALFPRNHLSRSDVVVNSSVLLPIIQFLGLRPSVNSIAAAVERFFALGKPAGKPVKRHLASYYSQVG